MSYLLEDFTAVDGKTILEPTRAFLHSEADVLEAMNQAHKNGQKIRIRKLIATETVVDWTQ
jgi:hypothetical protein